MLLQFARILCLLLSLASIGTIWVWNNRSGWITAVDWHSKKAWERGFEERVKELGTELNKGGDLEATLKELASIREGCGDVVFADRLFDPWRAAVELETELLVRERRFEEALPILRDAVQIDPTHIPLQMRFISALCMVGGAENIAQAGTLVDEWALKLPTHPDLRAVQMLQLALSGESTQLAQVISEHLYATVPYLTRGWQVYIFPEGKGSVEKSPLVNLVGPDEAGRYSITHKFPKAPKRLFQARLDGPLFTRARLSDFQVEMSMAGEPVEEASSWEWTSTIAVDPLPDGSYLMNSNKDPRMRMRFPKPLPAKAPVEFKVAFRLDPVLSTEMRHMLAEPGFRSEVAAELVRLGWEQNLDIVSPLPTGGAQ